LGNRSRERPEFSEVKNEGFNCGIAGRVMSDTNPRFFSPEENELAIFVKRYQSLPPGERETFRLYRHPCQDKSVEGLKPARACAEALQTEIGKHKGVLRVEVGRCSEGWMLVVVVNTDICIWEPFYRGYLVHRKVEYDKPRPGILQVVLSWLMNAFCWGRGHS
jgi:hypothetical protein